ncbi:EAL domain-containing protein [Azohydromonas australica]|uniref:EAL domain-containing protein n=1 Tax=Azohydromonas australica TaxID=364039 RepID=UPI00041B7A0D|nr:EAL domain-containing protein [Azohydromonas australica]
MSSARHLGLAFGPDQAVAARGDQEVLMDATHPKPAAVVRPGRAWLLSNDTAHVAQIETELGAEGWRVDLRLRSLQHLLLHLHCEASPPDVLVCGLQFDDGDAFGLMRLLTHDPLAPALFIVLQQQQRVVLKSVLAMAGACNLKVAGCAERPLATGQIAQALRSYRVAVPARAPAAATELTAEALRSMLKHDRLQVWLQPQLRVDSREVMGVQARLHGVAEDGTQVLPARLLPALRRHGLLEAATLALMRQTCGFLAECVQEGLPLIGSIKASMHSLSDPDFCIELQRIVQASKVDPAWITIEISESDAAGDLPTVIENTARCRLLGFNLCIADFGTAYSSLTQLAQLPLSELKFDRSLVESIDADTTRRTIVASCAGLARGLGLRVVADGVETAAELRALQAAGCTEVQGNLLTPPMSMDAMRQWLRGLDGLRVPLGKRRTTSPC